MGLVSALSRANLAGTTVDEAGAATFSAVVTNVAGSATTSAATLTVINVPPTVGAVTITPEPSIKHSAVVASAPFGDPGPNDAPFIWTMATGQAACPARWRA